MCADKPEYITKLRAAAVNVTAFDKELESNFNLYTPKPETDFPNANSVWNKFQYMFTTVNGIFSYLPTYVAYHRRILEELYEDNVMYAEIRTGVSPVSQ